MSIKLKSARVCHLLCNTNLSWVIIGWWHRFGFLLILFFAQPNEPGLNQIQTRLVSSTYLVLLSLSFKVRWALKPQDTLWFPRIRLFVVKAISLGHCRRPIEFLTSSHPCRCFSKIPNSQIHKVEKWKILSNFLLKNFYVISHEHINRFFFSGLAKKTLWHIKQGCDEVKNSMGLLQGPILMA